MVAEQRFTRNWVELPSLFGENLITLMPVMNNFDEINNFFYEQYWNKIRDLREADFKSWRDGRIEAISRVYIRYNFEEKKIRTLKMNSRSRFSNYRMKFIAWMIREFEQRCWISTQWTIPRYQSASVFSHFWEILAECKAVFWKSLTATIGRKAIGTQMVNRETFL